MSATTDDLKESYISWLRQKLHFKEVNGTIEITTPLLDRHNDHIQIYVTQTRSGSVRLTDAGYILNDLELDGVNVFSSPKRKEIFRSILSGYGISYSKSGELYAEGVLDTFPQKKHMLVQAMMMVNDMFMTARSNITSLFVEDVASFLDQHDIRYTPDVSFIGKTGFIQRFDFVIPKSKEAPERVIKSVNAASKSNTNRDIFAWDDTRKFRSDESELYVILNDGAKSVSRDILNAYQEYGIKSVLWSRRNDYLAQLTA